MFSVTSDHCCLGKLIDCKQQYSHSGAHGKVYECRYAVDGKAPPNMQQRPPTKQPQKERTNLERRVPLQRSVQVEPIFQHVVPRGCLSRDPNVVVDLSLVQVLLGDAYDRRAREGVAF